MNDTRLTAFAAVAESGGFTKGAEKLLVSQPAVSLQVAELESSLGVKLFDRLPRGIRLTTAGELLLGYAQRISRLHRDAEQSVRDLLGLQSGRLTIGASLTIGSYLMPKVICEFYRAHPAIEISMEIANTHEIQIRLAEGKLDLGFTEGLIESDRLESAVFATDELVAVAPPKHPLVGKRRVTAKHVCAEPLILREPGSGTRAVVERALRSRGLSVRPTLSLGSAEAVKSAVLSGIGLAIMSRLAVARELAEGSLVMIPMTDLQIRRDLHRLWLRGSEPSPAAGKFVSLMQRDTERK